MVGDEKPVFGDEKTQKLRKSLHTTLSSGARAQQGRRGRRVPRTAYASNTSLSAGHEAKCCAGKPGHSWTQPVHERAPAIFSERRLSRTVRGFENVGSWRHVQIPHGVPSADATDSEELVSERERERGERASPGSVRLGATRVGRATAVGKCFARATAAQLSRVVVSCPPPPPPRTASASQSASSASFSQSSVVSGRKALASSGAGRSLLLDGDW